MYGKLVDGALQTPPQEISRNIKQMKEAGFKPVIDSKPGYNVETEDAVFVNYVDTGIYIRAVYQVIPIEPTKEEQIIEQTNKAMELLNINLNDLLSDLTDGQALLIPLLFPKWRKDVEYKVNNRVRYLGKIYKVLQDHTSQEGLEPDINSDLFEKTAKKVVDDNEQAEILEWEKHNIKNPYMKGDKVTYQDKTYISKIDINLTTPGDKISGWEEIVDEH